MGHHDLTIGFPKDLESKDFASVFFRVAARQRREPYAGKGSYNDSQKIKNGSASLNCVACPSTSTPTRFSEEGGRG